MILNKLYRKCGFEISVDFYVVYASLMYKNGIKDMKCKTRAAIEFEIKFDASPTQLVGI